MNINLFARTRKYEIIGFALVIIYLMPYIVLGENARISEWDNLDSLFVCYKILFNEGLTFKPNSSVVNSFMSGITRNSMPLELNFTTLFYWLLGPLPSYIAEKYIIHLSAFIGMNLLLKKHILNYTSCPSWLIPSISLCYAILPFWHYGGLSVAGFPLLFYAFMNFRSGNQTKWDWVILLIFPFYSHLVLVGVFIIFIFCIILIYDFFKSKRLKLPLITFIGVITVLYLISNYRYLLSFIFHSNYVSHRTEFRHFQLNDISTSIKTSISHFINGYGEGHAISLIYPYILFVVIIGLFISFEAKYPTKRLIFIIVFIGITSLITGYKDSTFFSPVDTLIKNILPIQYDRFYFLHPFLWYVLFSITSFYIIKFFRLGKIIIIPVLTLQILMGFKNSEVIKNEIKHRFHGEYRPTFKGFFAQEQFDMIKQKINLPLNSYRVASIGIHPSVSQYNGFYTIDGYCADYPIQYKHKFRKIIVKELEKNENLKKYFDFWGNRAYLFTEQDFGQMVTKNTTRERVIYNLELNTDLMLEMNCKYLISALKIDESSSKGLKFIEKFKDENSAWDIWLFEVSPI